MGLSRRTVLILGVGGATLTTLVALQDPLEESPGRPRLDITEPSRPVPADAIWVHPNGSDNNPGTETRPRATPTADATNVLSGGTYPGFSWFAPNGTTSTLLVPEGVTAVLDGRGGTERALTASGVVNLYGDGHVTGYAPAPSRDTNCVAVYYGGTAAGSEIDGWTIKNSTQAALGFQVPLKLTRLLVADTGYSGILGTNADGMVLGDVRVLRVNRDNHSRDGQLGAIKIVRSQGLHFSSGVHVEDTGGAVGLWCDVSCRDVLVTGSTVRTGSGTPAAVGLMFEETEGGLVFDADIEGVEALRIAATGGMRVWSSRFTGTSIAARLWQDRNRNSGTNLANLPADEVPWWTTGIELGNNSFTATGGYRIALTAYADGPAAGQLLGKDMITSLRGNRFTGYIVLGRLDGGRDRLPPVQLAGALGTKYDAAIQPLPADVAALLGA